MIKMLYDHWAADLHWSGYKKDFNNFDVGKLNQINKLLRAALQRYENWIISQDNREIDQTMMFNVHSLIALSEFQKDLYTKLSELKKSLKSLSSDVTVKDIRLKEAYAIRNMILDVLDCYERHTKNLSSIIQNSVIDIPSDSNDLNTIIERPKNTSEILSKTYKYAFYEVYFRKLDYNICLLILDNLHSLKLRLIMPEDSYQKLENKIYLYIYHLSNNWSLYIPEKKNMKTKTYLGRHNNIDCFFSIEYNADTFEQGLHIIYLEKLDFENALRVFKDQLQVRNIEENIRMDKSKLSNQETNSLLSLPELRDIYSLKRMSQHIAQLQSIDLTYARKYQCLLAERALQIVGEFLKTTNETLHLQPSTEALIEVEISVEIVNDLKSLRDLLCHVKDGELLKRIEIETNHTDIAIVIFEELKFIKEKIDEVIMTCKPLVENKLILNGLSLIEKRRNEMPPEVAIEWFSSVKRVRLLPQNEPYGELFTAPKGYADEYATEVIMLVEHSLQLDSKLRLVNETILNNLIQKFTVYKDAINISLQKIIEVKKNWKHIVDSLRDEISVTLSNVPNENDANRIKTCLKQGDLTDNLRHDLVRYVQDNKSFAYAEVHWKFIKKILEFIILKTNTSSSIPIEFKKIIEELNELSYVDNIEIIVTNYLDLLEKKIVTIRHNSIQYLCPEFKGIKELKRKLTMTNFLIHEEKKHLIDTLKTIKSKSNKKRQEKIETMITKISNDEAIPKREYTNFISTLNLDNKAQKYLMNLVMGYKRDPLHLWSLIKRITILREITQDQSADKLVTRYKLDTTFRAVLEMVVFDIFEILECTKNNVIVKKSSKLLTEMNLRNFLIHGSPLLEIAGNVLDSNDLPSELIAKSFELLKEERSINGLWALRDLNFDFTKINSESLSPQERTLVIDFKTSARWKDYLTFIPGLKQTDRRKANGNYC